MVENIMTKKASNWMVNSAGIKILVIFALILSLLIPSSMVKSLIRERENRKHDVIREISSKWAESQTITGPVISVPYKKYYEDKNRKQTCDILYFHFLPDNLDINSEVLPEIRYRGIYRAVLYNTKFTMTGSFTCPDPAKMNIQRDHIIWSGATISIGITDMRGIKDQISASINNSPLTMNSGLETNDVICSGISSKMQLRKEVKKYTFKFDMNLNGSQSVNFAPVGKVTNAAMSSSWPDPSFDGAFLPYERSINKDGFKAKWKVLHLNRNYPQYWKGSGQNLQSSEFGVKMFIPVDVYQKSMRTAKYALMFIVFTFMAFFLSEILNRKRVHPIQYLLIGLAITIFYSLLISLSEHAGFAVAYLISSLSVIILITGYSFSILNNKTLSIMVGSILTVLYTYVYVLLQLKDYALLMGSVGLLIVLGIVMYKTRNIDWYEIKLND